MVAVASRANQVCSEALQLAGHLLRQQALDDEYLNFRKLEEPFRWDVQGNSLMDAHAHRHHVCTENNARLLMSMSKLEYISYKIFSPRLELVDLVLAISEILEVAIKLSLVARRLLASTDSLVHAWRTTDKYLDLLALLRLR